MTRSDLDPITICVDDAAALAGIDRKTMYDMVRDNEVPGVRRFGRAIRIHRETFEGWLKGDEPTAASEG